MTGYTHRALGGCQWPIGDPAEPGFRFCGRPISPGSAYCPAHFARAYRAAADVEADAERMAKARAARRRPASFGTSGR